MIYSIDIEWNGNRYIGRIGTDDDEKWFCSGTIQGALKEAEQLCQAKEERKGSHMRVFLDIDWQEQTIDDYLQGCDSASIWTGKVGKDTWCVSQYDGPQRSEIWVNGKRQDPTVHTEMLASIMGARGVACGWQ